MAQEYTRDCCKRTVEVVSESWAMLRVQTFQTFTAGIKEETDLNDGDALDLAGDTLRPYTFPQWSSACRYRIKDLLQNDGAVGTVTLA
jgi:hypothetical protein